MAKRKARPIAHIVNRRELARVKAGDIDHTDALCGMAVRADAEGKAPVCQTCVLKQLVVDDTKAAESTATVAADNRNALNTAREEGRVTGLAEGRTAAMAEIREAAERRATELAAAK